MADDPKHDPGTPGSWTEARFRALTLHSGDIVSLLDAAGRLLYNSPAAERISGFSEQELAGADTFQLMHPDDREAVAAAFSRVVAEPGASTTVRYRYARKGGGWTWMEAVALNQLDNPEVRGILATSRDITERVRAEEARAALEAQLAHKQRLEGLGTLAGGVAHDFNNLLGALLGHVELARDLTAEPAVRAELDAALTAVDRATELTRQLLGFARRQPARAVVHDLGQLLERLRPLLERILGGRIRVGLAAPAAPVWVSADPAQLEQVVVNLATNARDALPEGGRLDLALAVAAPGPGEPAGAAVLTARDDGTGIAPEHLARVFEPFFTTKPVGRGSGLGLAVSHGIVTQAGGTIRLESRPGQGTTAEVRLPLAAPPADAPLRAPAPSAAATARPGERLLLADDDDQVRGTVRRMLLRAGWEVDEARDGQEALVRIAAAAPATYAAAVFDVRMPILSGPEAARRLAALAPGLPVLLVSGYAEGAEALEGVLSKPFTGATLGRRVRELIDDAAGRR